MTASSRGGFRPSFDSSFRPLVREGAGKTGCRPRTRGPLREDVAQEEPHSSIQVVPITRPSLRSGLTAYAVLSREPNSFWPPSPRELTMRFTRLGSPHLRDSLTVATTARTTRFCRTRIRWRHRGRRHRARAIDMLARRTSQRRSSARGSRAHRDYPPCPPHLVPTLPRPPQARLAIRDDVRSPLKDEPGWATHTIFPNFGKVEYFARTD